MQKKQLQALTLEQKCALLSGATTFGTRALPKNNIPSITLSDGPNGVRKQAGAADHLGLNPSVPATCFPTAATVACSWDPALGEQIGQAMGEEAAAQEVAVLLGPGLNTKRSPLCGRNFEYFSEDPYLTGEMASAELAGLHSTGAEGTIKHFCGNNRETRRHFLDSVISERALREIYLRGFENAVKKGGVMASSSVGGLSGAFIPVSEDAGMIDAVNRGALSIEKLEAMTAVCSVGLDMIAVPGDTSADTISAIIADEAAIGMVNSKTTAVRVIPAIGMKEGDTLEFGGLFGSGPVMKLSKFSSSKFISRGGRIPAPLQSLKN